MNSLDLIPVDYRNRLQRKTALIRYAMAILAINALIFTIGGGLQYAVKEQTTAANQLKTQNAITQQQQAQLQQLKAQTSEYEQRWSLLRGLRAGAAVDDLFGLIDEAIVADELWFLSWSFRRAGVMVDGQRLGIETGYFVVVADNREDSGDHDLAVETHMKIHGQARDHQALSKFVRALFEQSDIKDVNVQKTSQTDYANGRVVDFDLTVVLNSASQES